MPMVPAIKRAIEKSKCFMYSFGRYVHGIAVYYFCGSGTSKHADMVGLCGAACVQNRRESHRQGICGLLVPK